MAGNKGNSNDITRRYLDSLLVETRYMNSANPDMKMELYGQTFDSPVMTAADRSGHGGDHQALFRQGTD